METLEDSENLRDWGLPLQGQDLDNFLFADYLGVIMRSLESKCRVR